MNWEAAGAIGEILGAIAVLTTLIYLALQIKQSNRFEAARHLDVHMDRIREFELELGRDADMSRIWHAGMAGEELTYPEIKQFNSLATVRVLIQRDAWLRARILENVVEDADMYLQILAGVIARNPGLKRLWDERYIPFRNLPGNINHEFVNRTTEILEEES